MVTWTFENFGTTELLLQLTENSKSIWVFVSQVFQIFERLNYVLSIYFSDNHHHRYLECGKHNRIKIKKTKAATLIKITKSLKPLLCLRSVVPLSLFFSRCFVILNNSNHLRFKNVILNCGSILWINLFKY